MALANMKKLDTNCFRIFPPLERQDHTEIWLYDPILQTEVNIYIERH